MKVSGRAHEVSSRLRDARQVVPGKLVLQFCGARRAGSVQRAVALAACSVQLACAVAPAACACSVRCLVVLEFIFVMFRVTKDYVSDRL